MQICDNCSSQYKSRRPFAELARSPLNIIHVYFGEKHGKSQYNGFFGRLKSWATFKIKARHFVITNAKDFFKCCRDEYQTPPPRPSECQHYHVVFQFLHPSDIRRYHDCDLDSTIPGTHSMYSICNTELPLKLKIRKTPCLCPPCITDNGEQCHNAAYTDPCKEVDLMPVKGQNCRKHMKRKHPNEYVTTVRNYVQHDEDDADTSSEDEIPPEVLVHDISSTEEEDTVVDLTQNRQTEEIEGFIDLMEHATDHPNSDGANTTEPMEETDVITAGEPLRIH